MFNLLLLLGTILLIFISFALFAGMVVGGVHILFSMILLCFGRDVEATVQSLVNVPQPQQPQPPNNNNNNNHYRNGSNVSNISSSYRRHHHQQRLGLVGFETGGGGGRAAPMPEYRVRVKYPIAVNHNTGDWQFVTKTFTSKNWNIFQDLRVGEIVLVRIWTRYCPGWAELSVDLPVVTWKLSSLALVVTTVAAVVYVWFLHKVVFEILPSYLVSYDGIDDELSRFYIRGVGILLVPIYFVTTIYTLTRTDDDAESGVSDYYQDEEGEHHRLTSSSSSSSSSTMRLMMPFRRLVMATRNLLSKIWLGLESERYHHHEVRNPGNGSNTTDDAEEMREMLPSQRRRIASRDFV